MSLAKGRTSSFEITVEGTLRYSKLEQSRFPTPEEVEATLG